MVQGPAHLNEPETVVDLLKNGLFVRLYEPAGVRTLPCVHRHHCGQVA